MNKKEKIKYLKPALLLSVALDLDYPDDIIEASGAIIDELYTMPTMRQSTFVADMAKEFEKRISTEQTVVAQLLLDTLRDTGITGNRFNRLTEALSEFITFDKRNEQLHHKTETLIRKKYADYVI